VRAAGVTAAGRAGGRVRGRLYIAPVLSRAALAAIGMLALAGMLAPPASATAPYVRKYPPLLTPWTRSVSYTEPLPQYPRPQLERSQWMNLNGQWQYEQGQPGQAPPFGQNLAQTILVPYPVQSPLSGIERQDTYGWYRRTFKVPASWAGKHVILNFGAVSWEATAYVNGKLAGRHFGDYDAFSFDITRLLHKTGPNELVVGFYDPIGGAGEPVGKQTADPSGILHTASSGIWQTVWLEPVSADHITALDLVPDVAHSRLEITASTTGGAPVQVVAQALAENSSKVLATATGPPGHAFSLRIHDPQLWSPSSPYLYGLHLELISRGKVIDDVQSYFGMRSITLAYVGGATRILLNGHFLFETGALDQGYWPDGLYTPPTEAAIESDIENAKTLGYNMLREHQKVQPDLWYYWADKLGLLVWQDMPEMHPPGDSGPTPAAQAEFRRELRAIVVQHRSDPSIVMWIPFNEGWQQFDPSEITQEVKSLEPSVPVDSDSGSADCCNAIEPPNSSVNDTHLYTGPFAVSADSRATVIGEYGGVLAYPPAAHRWPGVLTSIGSPVAVWGEGPVINVLKAQYEELQEEMRIRGLSGAVFTELTGTEDELGIVTYDRKAFTMPVGIVRGLNDSLIAASEKPASALKPQPAAVPAGTSGLWYFGEGSGTETADASGYGHNLTLEGGAGWTTSPFHGGLNIAAPGQYAVAESPLINTAHSFTISAWLDYFDPGESGTAVSETGPKGWSSFSLGIDTGPQGGESYGGVPGASTLPDASWWTFAAPSHSTCDVLECATRANLRYTDGRLDPNPRHWHLLTAVYDASTATIQLYEDGVPDDVEHTFGLPPAVGPLTVGQGVGDYSPNDTFIGAVAELRIYNRALSPAEAWQLYAAERPRELASIR
jgi:Concanavalin A-like lectin/glucanases superfamily/Glycosyl hydrolases family 2, sugar binding domain/Glycosyl hydrolases family 2